MKTIKITDIKTKVELKIEDTKDNRLRFTIKNPKEENKPSYFTSFSLNEDEAAILFEGLTYFFENDEESDFLTDEMETLEKLYKILGQTDKENFIDFNF